MLIGFILGGEIAFWLLIAAGLTARYLLRRRRLGGALLASAPLVDLVLLVAVTVDLRDGGRAGPAHALAAVYIGLSVGFGRQMVDWADVRFAHRFAGGPAPTPKPRGGRAHAALERRTWRRHLLAWGVGCGLLLAATVYVGDAERSAALLQTAGLWTVVLVIDGIWSFSYTLRPRPEPAGPTSAPVQERTSERVREPGR